MGAIEGVTGILLTFLGATFFIYSLPTLTAVLTTGEGTTWENSSLFVQNGINSSSLFITVMPFLILIIGLGISYREFRRGG